MRLFGQQLLHALPRIGEVATCCGQSIRLTRDSMPG